MPDQGEFIEDWEIDDETRCPDCGGQMRRLWRRHSNGKDRYLNKCWECGFNVWEDA